MSFRTEPRTLEDKLAAVEEQMRRLQTGVETLVVTNLDPTLLATAADAADAELLGWLGLVLA